MAEWEEKVWGKTKCDVESEFYSLHSLEIEAGGFSSCHYHSERANRFIVHSGILRVVWLYGWWMRYKELTTGNILDIPSQVPHQFQCIEDSSVCEEYWPDRNGIVKNEDIIRMTRGGKVTVESLKMDVSLFDEEGNRQRVFGPS